MTPSIRHPAVAGSFYPSDPHELEALLKALLKSAPEKSAAQGNIKAIMVPHAGYRYSGRVAAAAYNALRHRSFQTVFIMGNAHAHLFEGIALDGNQSWMSPLGEVPLQTGLIEQLHREHPELVFLATRAHQRDHILEVQLPFLQHCLKPGFSIVPMLFGNNPPDIYRSAAAILETVLQQNDLVIVSTDLSHYPSYHDATTIDKQTLKHIVNKEREALDRHVQETLQQNIPNEETLFCGPDAVRTLLQLARHFGWEANLLCYANSGDSPGADRDAVVGYGAVEFHEPA